MSCEFCEQVIGYPQPLKCYRFTHCQGQLLCQFIWKSDRAYEKEVYWLLMTTVFLLMKATTTLLDVIDIIDTCLVIN